MKKLWSVVFAILGISAFTEKDGKKVLTDEQFAKLKETLGEEIAAKFVKDLADVKDDDPSAEHAQKINDLTAQLTTAQTALEKEKQENTANAGKIAGFETQIKTLQTSIAALMASSEDPNAGKKPIPGSGGQGAAVDHTVALFGMTNNPLMALQGRPWNQRAARALGAEVVASNSIDYSQLSADLGAYYRTRKDDSIKSFVRKLPTNERLFPLESGYQDETVLINAFLSEFSQAFQNTFTAKGGYELQPEKIKMYDVKFDHKFSELKNLEKQWIGYLNREGSDAMKWSFIEYILAETAKKLHNEREQRRIRGVYVAPTAGVAGPSINGANGLLKFIKDKITNLQIKPFILGEWTPSNIVDYVFEMSMLIPQDLRDTGELVAYMSTDAKIYYDKNFESKYGQNSNYSGPEEKVKFIKSIKTEAVNNMGSSQRIFITLDGNIRCFEDKPNEMYKFNFEQEDRTLKVWSDWKEGVWAFMVGKKFATEAEQDYDHQMIFVNDVDEPSTYFIDVPANDTTPSCALHKSLKTGVNTGATAITDIDDMAIGDTVVLKCGSDNAYNSTIAASGKFANMSAAWNPDLNDTITLYKRGASDIIDLARTTASDAAETIAADDTTPTVAAGTVFITSANTVATAITDLDNPTVGETYTIYGGSNTNSSTIANSGNFDLTAAMTLSLGAYIKLYCRADNDYVELERG